MLKLTGFRMRYGAGEAVRGIDMEIGKGEIIALLGANGAGEPATMNAVTGLMPVAQGRAMVDGRDIADLPPRRSRCPGSPWRPRAGGCLATLTVEDDVRMGAHAVQDPEDIHRAQERAFALLPILEERGEQGAGTLSGSQQRMLAPAIGRAPMCAPRLFLTRQKHGIANRAAAEDFAVARLTDIRATTVISAAFALSDLRGGRCRALGLADLGGSANGVTLVLKAFIAAILGGLGSLRGAVAGGFLLGFVEVFLAACLPTEWQAFREPIGLNLVVRVPVAGPSGLIPAATRKAVKA